MVSATPCATMCHYVNIPPLSDDFAVDDLVATKLLKMGEISQSSVESGTGFLPMFGPAYIPFYGSHREYSDVYDKFSELNHGVVSPISSFIVNVQCTMYIRYQIRLS